MLSELLPLDGELRVCLTCHGFSSSAPYPFAETTRIFPDVGSFRFNRAVAHVRLTDSDWAGPAVAALPGPFPRRHQGRRAFPTRPVGHPRFLPPASTLKNAAFDAKQLGEPCLVTDGTLLHAERLSAGRS